MSSSEGCGELDSHLSLTACAFPAALGLLSLSYSCLPICMSAFGVSLFIKMAVILVHDFTWRPCFVLITSAKNLFQVKSNKVMFWGHGVGTSIYEYLGEHNSNFSSRITSSLFPKVTFPLKWNLKLQNAINSWDAYGQEISPCFIMKFIVTPHTKCIPTWLCGIMVNYIWELNPVYQMSS